MNAVIFPKAITVIAIKIGEGIRLNGFRGGQYASASRVATMAILKIDMAKCVCLQSIKYAYCFISVQLNFNSTEAQSNARSYNQKRKSAFTCTSAASWDDVMPVRNKMASLFKSHATTCPSVCCQRGMHCVTIVLGCAPIEFAIISPLRVLHDGCIKQRLPKSVHGMYSFSNFAAFVCSVLCMASCVIIECHHVFGNEGGMWARLELSMRSTILLRRPFQILTREI